MCRTLGLRPVTVVVLRGAEGGGGDGGDGDGDGTTRSGIVVVGCDAGAAANGEDDEKVVAAAAGICTGMGTVSDDGPRPKRLPAGGVMSPYPGAGEADRGVAEMGVPGAVGSGVLVGSAMVYVGMRVSGIAPNSRIGDGGFHTRLRRIRRGGKGGESVGE